MRYEEFISYSIDRSPTYTSSKNALTMLTECLRLELIQIESNIKITVSISIMIIKSYLYYVNDLKSFF